MASQRANFEKELKAKLSQKSNSHQGDEAVLIKAFKFFDLDNSGQVSKTEWLRAIERIGVSGFDQGVLETLFSGYDTDRSGELDYKEFSVALFGGNTPAGRTSKMPQSGIDFQQADEALENLRKKLAARGARGIIGLGKQFRIMDDDNSRSVEIHEFSKAIIDYRVGIPESDIQLIFAAIDRNGNGSIDYDEFLRAIRGQMNSFRKTLVQKAFAKLDADQSGVLDISDVKRFYNAAQHPDVKAGRKTEDDVLDEFLETFETHHSLEGCMDHQVTKDEFNEYYTNVSASIDNDQYFELMMNNAWKLSEPPAYTKKAAWSNKQEDPQEQFSTSYSQGFSPVKRQAVSSGAPGAQGSPSPSKGPRGQPLDALGRVRAKLASRGTRGILGLSRVFKIIDDNNSKTIDMSEWRKACNDYRLDLNEREMSECFASIDRDGSGEVDYDELLRAIRGPMNEFRTNLVKQAFKKLDRDGSGTVDIDDMRGVYSAKSHPDVRAGKKSEEDVLCDFLETFELHHNISDKACMDHRVTWDEFEEYYNNVSASIDKDAYFETMISNAWNLYGEPVSKKSWAGEYPGRDFIPNHKQQMVADQHRGILAGSTSKAAPWGTTDEVTTYETFGRPQSKRQPVSSGKPAGTAAWPGQVNTAQQEGPGDAEQALQKFQAKLAQRGARGIIGLSRQFKIMDDNGNGMLEIDEFAKAVRDYRMEIPENEVQTLFSVFDRDGSGGIDYNEFLRAVRGDMSANRKALVERAFHLIDKTGDGILAIEDIKGTYNAKNHPDVRMGKKTEDEVLGEFLSTFETHHSITKGGAGLDQRVDIDEFMEYYNNISASIDDDRYFDLMMKNAWNFEGKTYAKAWGNDQTSPPSRKRYF